MSAEVTGGREWLATLDEAIRIAPDQTARVVGKGSLNVKKAWQKRWRGHPRIKGIPYTIGYDVTSNGVGAAGEIGPDLDRGGQAPLSHIIELGSPTSAPIPGGLPSLEEEAPRFEQALADMAVKLLGG